MSSDVICIETGQLRKVTKAKAVFPTDDSLFKMLYLAMTDITIKWTGRRQDWGRIPCAALVVLCRAYALVSTLPICQHWRLVVVYTKFGIELPNGTACRMLALTRKKPDLSLHIGNIE